MTTLNNLVSACGAEKSTLMSLAQDRMKDWDRWLQPLSSVQPVGEDPSYDDDFQRMREEVNRLSGFDTALICRLAEKLLNGVSKDLRIVTFYIWARLHQDGEAGLADGLELLTGLLQRFGSRLHPLRERSRQSALEWLGSSRMLDSLSLYPEVDMAVMQRISGALLLAEQAMSLSESEPLSPFGPLYQALEMRVAQSGGADSLVPQTSSEDRAPAAAPLMATVTSGRDLLDQARVLVCFLRDQQGGWLSAHHLMKSIRWDTLSELPPLDASGRTRLAPPKPDHRAHLKRLYLQQNWIALLEQTDDLFAQGVNHLWLDLQWYSWQARVKNDADSVCADILCRDLKGLLSRLPGLEALAFNDGTPFADEVTLNWINQHVMDDPADWHDGPVMAAAQPGDDVLMLEPELLEKADEEGIEAAFNWLQSRPGMISVRDRWLMRLLMARVAEQYGRNDLSLHLLGELDCGAQTLTLQQWSPELLFEVKARRLKLLRSKAARSESDKTRLQSAMDQLLSGLITLDPARATVLCG